MIRLEPAGAEALLLVLGEAPDDCRQTVRIGLLAEQLRTELGNWLLDAVPSWNSLLLHYDLRRCDHRQLVERVTPLLERWLAPAPQALPEGRLHRLPVWYAGEDLAAVARACGLEVTEVIELHSACEYRVGAIGFAPGFAYLGDLPEALRLPRLATPRIRVPAGSLAIAEHYTAIYPQASPGGWHLLGLCPQPLFDLGRTPPSPFAVGDRVRFVAIDEAEYRSEAASR